MMKDQVASVTEPWGLTLTFGYDASGNQTSVSDSLGGVETSNYGAAGELASRILTDASGTTLRVDLGYDEAGNVTSIVRSSDAAGEDVASTTTEGYDDGRVTSIVDQSAAGATVDSDAYTYNAAGEVIAENDGGVASNYSYDATGQQTGVNSTAYTYDAEGNETEDRRPRVLKSLARQGGTLWCLQASRLVLLASAVTVRYRSDHRTIVSRVHPVG